MKKKNKGNQQVLLLLVSVIVVVLLFKSPILKQSVFETDICDPNYKVCFTTNIDKSIPLPLEFKDLAKTSIELPSDTNTEGGFVHWPGSIMKIHGSWLINGRAGVPTAALVFNNGGTTNLLDPLKVECGGADKFEWRPDKIVWDCQTWSGNGIGGRYTEVETHPVSKYSFIVKFYGDCADGTNTCESVVSTSSQTSATWVTVGNYSGWRGTVSTGSTPATTNYYVLFKNAPDYNSGTNWVRFKGNYSNVAVFVWEPELDLAGDMLENPDTYISNAYDELVAWYRQFDGPSDCPLGSEGNWCRERYWRSVGTMANSIYSQYGDVTSLWGDKMAMSPGSGYNGVWIWDSFFASWAWVNNCKDQTCADTIFDSLRILVSNKYATGQWPREVWYATKGSGWQAPGGWSFAVDQADKKFNTNQYSTEFYNELKAFHEWVRTTDTDNDNLFVWGGTNSGWDASVRWANNQGGEALDLNAWMIIDAEALRNIANRLGLASDAAMWEQRRLDYIAAYQELCASPDGLCYDSATNSDTLSPVETSAMYFSLMAGAVSEQTAQNMIDEMYNPNTLGAVDPSGLGVLPTVSRDDPGFSPGACGGTPVWSGQQWINVNGIAWLGMLRYGFNTDATYLRDSTMLTLLRSGNGYESYMSADQPSYGKYTGDKTCNFNGPMYIWTDAFYMLFASGSEFDFAPVDLGNATIPNETINETNTTINTTMNETNTTINQTIPLPPACENFTSVNACVSWYAAQLSSSQNTIQQQAELISDLQLSALETAALINQLNLEIDDQAALIDELNAGIDEISDIIGGLQLTIAEKEQLVGSLNLTVVEKEQIIKNLKDAEPTPVETPWLTIGIAALLILFMLGERDFFSHTRRKKKR